MASEMGLTQQNVAGSVLVSLSSTSQVSPNYWVNPTNRVNYVLAVQTPPDRLDTVDALMNTPITQRPGRSARRRPSVSAHPEPEPDPVGEPRRNS